MCLAIPGKILEVQGEKVVVEYPDKKRVVRLLGLDIKVGEYVFVQAGIVVEKVPENEALKSLSLWEGLK